MARATNEEIENIELAPRLPPRATTRRSEPRILDWDPTVEEKTRGHGKFGRRRTAPSLENGPSGFRRILSSRTILGSSNSLNQNEKNSTPNLNSSITNSNIFDPFELIRENIRDFVFTTVPLNYPGLLRFSFRRNRQGFQRNFSPSFFLHLQRPDDEKKIFVLAARRETKINGHAKYLLTTTFEHLDEKWGGIGYVGKVQCHNSSATEFTLYDSGVSPKSSRAKHRSICRREIAAIFYAANPFGIRGPRKMSVVVPKTGRDVQPMKNEETLLDFWHNRQFNDFHLLSNQLPKIDPTDKTYRIQSATDRPSQPSVKNFQLLMDTGETENRVVMEFNRLEDDKFSCDFGYPLCAAQAFGIALSCFESRLLRE